MATTITYDESVKGWTSFHSFLPEDMFSLNGNFFSFKGGQIYQHNSNVVNRNNFYGVDYPSKLSFIMNEAPSEVKELKALKLEGNVSWTALIRAYLSDTDDYIESSIDAVEFEKREGMWYAHTRKNEDSVSTDPKSSYGIGRVTSINGLDITINGGNKALCVGDEIVKDDLTVVGTIQNIDSTTGIITLSSVTGLVNNDFIFGRKNSRIEGLNLRGYSTRIDLENSDVTKVELFAVNTEVIKSYT